MRLRLIRNATLRIRFAGRDLIVDPMLDPAGARPPVEDTADPRRNPLVELPEPAEIVVNGLDAAIVTHLHRDHLDATAIELLPSELPVFAQPEDAETLRGHGFTDVRPVDDALDWDGVRITRTAARHGTGRIGELMAPVSGFVLASEGEPVLYAAGDTIWCDEVAAVLDAHRPAVVVVNGGIVAVHLEAINHCPQTRADLHQRLRDEGLTDRVTVPEDGAEVPLPGR
jgi:L-ascorbate metabolism protein UlaG (beta-lactamase superfamily)